MSFIGKLDDVRFPDLLAFIGARRMSGKLTLRVEGEGGAILFRQGRIVAAVSSEDPQAIGSLLVAGGHLSEQDLHRTLELQKQGLVEGRLTNVLSRNGTVSLAVLEDVVERKMRRIVDGFLDWSSGYFQFEPARIADHGEIVVDPSRLVPAALAVSFAEYDAAPASETAGSRAGEESTEEEEGAPPRMVKVESPGPSLSGEATGAMLAAAQEDFLRGLLFLVRRGAFREIASFGVAPPPADASGLQELQIPRQEPSFLRDAADLGTPIRGSLDRNEWNQALVRRLGGDWPIEGAVIPAVVSGRTLLAFYGDRLPEARPAHRVPTLERVMAEVAAAMEQDLISRRQRRETPSADLRMETLEDPVEPHSLATLSTKLDRLIQQNESLLHEYGQREQSFWHLAHHDPLTGLPNRFLFRELLAKELAHARQEGDNLAVAIFNVDHFKDVNDHLGEDLGDELLTEIAAKISRIVRAEDTLARLRGDEFALVIPKCSQADNAMLVVRRVFDAFAEALRVRQKEILLSVSMGISFYPEDGRGTSELVLNAETALKRAKESGRNKFQVFAPTMNEWAQVRMELAQDLRRAIATNQGLSVLFQPIVDIESGRVVGAEALLRWQPPERSPIEARTLIELAEDTGQMPALGGWVLHRACELCMEWQRSSGAVPVWVNVSIRQLQAGGLVEEVMKALHETGLPPELLRIEITESIAALNLPEVREILDRLDKLGISVVLDDFGAGYSSLSYLMKFSVTGLKIDGSFVSGVPNHEESCAVVDASVGIGNHLGLDVVAEGVESEDQLTYLRERGCPLAQGMHLSPPLLPEHLEKLLRGGGAVPTR